MNYVAFITFSDSAPIEVFSESASYLAKLLSFRIRYSIQRKACSEMTIKIKKS